MVNAFSVFISNKVSEFCRKRRLSAFCSVCVIILIENSGTHNCLVIVRSEEQVDLIMPYLRRSFITKSASIIQYQSIL